MGDVQFGEDVTAVLSVYATVDGSILVAVYHLRRALNGGHCDPTSTHYTAQYQNVSDDRVTKDQSKHNSLVALRSSALCISNDIDTVELHSSSL